MKKILAVILTLILILTLTACGGKNNDGAGAPDDSIQTPAEPSPFPRQTRSPPPARGRSRRSLTRAVSRPSPPNLSSRRRSRF